MLRLLVMMALVCLLTAPPAAAGNQFGPSYLRAPGYEQVESRQDRLMRQRQQGQILPLGTIINIVGQQIPGRFLDARFREGRRPLYEVIWRSPKGKRIVTVDARSGKILRVR